MNNFYEAIAATFRLQALRTQVLRLQMQEEYPDQAPILAAVEKAVAANQRNVTQDLAGLFTAADPDFNSDEFLTACEVAA